MKLPRNEEEVKDFLTARAKEVNEERPNWDKGLSYVNGFHDGTNYAMQRIHAESRAKLADLKDKAGIEDGI